jgi:hypothetical protein
MHQSMIDLGADDAARVSEFHSLRVGKAGGELLRSSPPLVGANEQRGLQGYKVTAGRTLPAPNPINSLGREHPEF